MTIIKTDYLTDDMLDSMTDLVLDVNEADSVRYAVPDDADYYALCYADDNEDDIVIPEEIDVENLDPDGLMGVIALYEMGETHREKTVIELSAFTAPKFRRKQVFKNLLSSLREELSDFAVRFAVYEGAANLEALKKAGAVFDHDEVMMALKLEGADLSSDADFKVETEAETIEDEGGSYMEFTVNTPYGRCYARLYEKRAYIFGILTHDSKRRKGYASVMLKRLMKLLRDEYGAIEATLEVATDNEPAFSLYKKLGFEVMDRLSYYYLPDGAF